MLDSRSYPVHQLGTSGKGLGNTKMVVLGSGHWQFLLAEVCLL